MRERFERFKYKTGYNIGRVIANTGKQVEQLRAKRGIIQSPRSILITGASSGIGSELARQYAAPGVFLYLTGRNADRLARVQAYCASAGAKCEIKVMDICDDIKVERWVQELPRVDLVIADAGVSGGSTDNDEVREIFSVNVGGVLNTILPYIEKARKQALVDGTRGHIAIVSSMAGFRGLPGAPAYSASKVCVAAYAEAIRGALKHEKIHVTSIHPGYIKTPMTAGNNFKMPLLMDVDKAALRIRKGLAARRARVIFPLEMYLVIRFLNMLPYGLTDWIFRMAPKKV